jgi:hypothetical protein
MCEIEETPASPESTPPAEDVGADTQRRFRYQACYVAILSLGLLDDDGPLQELYCEHHDDVVLRLRSGKFRAIQIKTRGSGSVPFTAVEDPIVSSLRKFADLETIFSCRFDAYLLASNVGFWHEKKNGSNLTHILNTVRTGTENGFEKFIKRIADKKPPIAGVVVKAALRKVELVDTPGLDDVEPKLREQLAQIPEFRNRRYDELKTASEAHRDRILEASSLPGLNLLPVYLELCSDSPQSVRDQHVIQTKRISKAIVQEALNRGLLSPTLLRSHQPVPIEELPTGMKTMEIKMAAGGLSVSEIDHLKDLKFSAETLLQEWYYRYGPDRAQQYYEHLRVLVREECLAAQQGSQQISRLYGSGMLSDLRRRLRERLTIQGGATPECSQEHLLGMAGILTEDCKVWWSTQFDLLGGNS